MPQCRQLKLTAARHVTRRGREPEIRLPVLPCIHVQYGIISDPDSFINPEGITADERNLKEVATVRQRHCN